MTLELAQNILQKRRRPRMPMREGLLYEPRAFWGVGYYDTRQVGGRPVGVVRLPRDFFLNGEKFPVTLIYACVAPVGYTFDLYNNTGAASVANTRNDGAAAVLDAQIVLSSPQRQHYMRVPGLLQAFPPEPRWENGQEQTSAVVPAVQRSSPFNTYAWDFDAPMVLANRANLDFELSRYTLPGFMPGTNNVYAYVGFHEIGSTLFQGISRIDNFLVQAQQVVAGDQTLYGADGFGFSAGGQGVGSWNPTQKFSAREFTAQSQSSEGSVPIVGFEVMLQQQEYDNLVIATAPALTVAPTTIASLGTRIGTRARMRQGGTGAFWWREGAPLALVSPHRTVAQVHELHKPITLDPGDSLEVELTMPLAMVDGETTRDRITQVGVSLCGYAAIES